MSRRKQVWTDPDFELLSEKARIAGYLLLPAGGEFVLIDMASSADCPSWAYLVDLDEVAERLQGDFEGNFE